MFSTLLQGCKQPVITLKTCTVNIREIGEVNSILGYVQIVIPYD